MLLSLKPNLAAWLLIACAWLLPPSELVHASQLFAAAAGEFLDPIEDKEARQHRTSARRLRDVDYAALPIVLPQISTAYHAPPLPTSYQVCFRVPSQAPPPAIRAPPSSTSV